LQIDPAQREHRVIGIRCILQAHHTATGKEDRTQARKRDVSFQTKNEKGTQAKDTMMTVVETAKKMLVNVFEYIHDRICKKYEMPSLASIISSQSQYTASDPAISSNFRPVSYNNEDFLFYLAHPD